MSSPESALSLDATVALLRELLDGPPGATAWALNPGDEGLLKSLDRLSADAASAAAEGRSSIAAHVHHLRYGFELLNRWSTGEEPFADANFAESWRHQKVDERQWRELRETFAREARAWAAAAAHPRETSVMAVTGTLASVVHLAYHLGAIRQIDPTTRGPKAAD